MKTKKTGKRVKKKMTIGTTSTKTTKTFDALTLIVVPVGRFYVWRIVSSRGVECESIPYDHPKAAYDAAINLRSKLVIQSLSGSFQLAKRKKKKRHV